jgi:hypothetical protein
MNMTAEHMSTGSISADVKSGSVLITATLRALSDDKSLILFNMAASIISRDTGVIMNKLGLTRKQYYSKMNRLINAGLVIRKSGKYFLSSFGTVVYASQILIGQGIEDYWKLKAIDSIERSLPHHDLPAGERKHIIDTLIERNHIKSILLNHNIPSGKNDKPESVVSALPQLHVNEL